MLAFGLVGSGVGTVCSECLCGGLYRRLGCLGGGG